MTKRPRTRGQAINAFCKECIYDKEGGVGTWRQQVEACTSTNCPLYDFRPVPRGGPEGSYGEDGDLPLESETGAVFPAERTETASMEHAA